jgi:hypothetical protein
MEWLRARSVVDADPGTTAKYGWLFDHFATYRFFAFDQPAL